MFPPGYGTLKITIENNIHGANSTDFILLGQFFWGLDNMKMDIILLPRRESKELSYN